MEPCYPGHDDVVEVSVVAWFFLALACAQPAPDFPLLLDAGPLASPVFDDMQRLDLEGSTDPRAHWTSPPTRAFAGNWPDPLLGDGLLGGTLQLDLAPGRWRIAAMISPERSESLQVLADDVGLVIDGREDALMHRPKALADWLASPWYTANPRPVFRQAESIFQRQLADEGAWHEQIVDVPQGGISVQVRGWTLRGLVAIRADNPAGDLLLLELNHRRYKFFSRHIAAIPPSPPEAVQGPLGAHWVSIDDPLAGALPHAELHLARGDRQSLALWIEGGDAPGKVTVEAPKGVRVDVAEASWLDLSQHPDRPLRAEPAVLWDGPSFAGAQGVPPVLVMTVHTDERAKAGVFMLPVRVERGEEHFETTLKLHVAPVRTCSECFHAGLFADPDMAVLFHEGPDAPETWALMDDLLVRLAHEGFDAISLRNLFAGLPTARTPADAADRAKRAQAIDRRWHELGGTVFEWGDPWLLVRLAAYEGQGDITDPNYAALYAAMWQGDWPITPWFRAWEENGWRNPAASELGRKLGAILHATHPRPILSATMPMPQDLLAADAFDVVMTGPIDEHLCEDVQQIKATGALAWGYNLAPGRAGPLRAWACGAQGLLQWHTDDVLYDPFDHAMPLQRWQHTLLGPDATHHATVLLSAMADGLADARLLASAQAWAASRHSARAHEVNAILEALKDALAHAKPDKDGLVLAPDAMNTVRAALLRAWAGR